MEQQYKRDRSVRQWLWVLELLFLLATAFVCFRVSSPDLLCPDDNHTDDVTGSTAAARWLVHGWRRLVCGSWGGLLAPAGDMGEGQEVSKLQAERTRSLNQALDKIVRRSATSK